MTGNNTDNNPYHSGKLRLDHVIKFFFGGNAFASIVVLVLITIFLFREGAGFFPQSLANLRIYRQAGLEYVDLIRVQADDHTALSRYLQDLRQKQFAALLAKKQTPEQATAALAGFDRFASSFDDTVDGLRSLVSDLKETVSAVKARAVGAAEAKKPALDYKKETAPLRAALPLYRQTTAKLRDSIGTLLASPPVLPVPELQPRMEKFRKLTNQYLAGFPAVEQRLEEWNPDKPVPWRSSVSAFLLGRDWITNSFWQDFYGVLPLLTGSVLVSLVALLISVPFGVCTAVYVNEFATDAEQRFIKPFIEFISAIPSVVLGFFGIAVLGQTVRWITQISWLQWVPGFPISERLNVFTAGALLALMAIPTIFSLSEDALNNVPGSFKEASFALGGTRLQTMARILIPASLSGIISAVLLGFGRVIGETMVVLLCAGNRIAIPDFSQGLGAFFQPVHTMTGIIAQEMGEVVPGSTHYRALFMVGILLFFLSLLINFLAQLVVRKFRISIG